MALKRCTGFDHNHFELVSGERYWVSGVKKKGSNRHWAGGGPILIEKSLLDWYEDYVQQQDFNDLIVIDDLPNPDISKFNDLENRTMVQQEGDSIEN